MLVPMLNRLARSLKIWPPPGPQPDGRSVLGRKLNGRALSSTTPSFSISPSKPFCTCPLIITGSQVVGLRLLSFQSSSSPYVMI